ncbi:hypothetical protein T4B_1310, partial [Trichinella pseudospiralis]
LTSGLEKPFCREGINMSLTSTHGSLSFVLLPQQFRWNLQSTEDVKSEAALTQSVRLRAARGEGQKLRFWIPFGEMKPETVKKWQQIEQRRLRGVIRQVVEQIETVSSEVAVRNTLSAMDAQYAEAHRAQEVLMTRTKADTFLKEKDTVEATDVKPALTQKLSPQSSLGKLQRVPLDHPPRNLNQRMGLRTDSRLDSLQSVFTASTDNANELELQDTLSSMTVRSVHGLSATVADSCHVRFLFGPMHEKIGRQTVAESGGGAAAGQPRSRPATLESTATAVGQEGGHGEGIRGCYPDLPRQWMSGASGRDRWSAWADVVALQADIEKMYLQISLRPEDRDVCRFLWQEAGVEALVKTHRLTRVGFSLACSLFLTMQVVRQHARQCGESDTLIDRVLTYMYGDNLATSCDDSGEAHNLQRRLCVARPPRGRLITVWGGAALEDFGPLLEPVQRPSHLCDPPEVLAKQLFQTLWLRGIDWADCLPADIDVMSCRWKEKLDQLPTIRVPCALLSAPREQLQRVELHVFSDSSETPYGVVAYLLLKAQGNGGGSEKLTLPRLELMAALLTAWLKSYVEKELGIQIERHVCWSDSSIVLSWIQGDPRRWEPFVSNRGQEILRMTEPHPWRHCPISNNPGDKLSSCCALDRLREDQLWWNGQAWLKDSAEKWLSMNIALSAEEAQVTSPERRNIVALCASPQEASLFVIMDESRYGTMERLIQITAYCFQLVANVRTRPGERKIGTQLSLLELQNAEKRFGESDSRKGVSGSKDA